jgi:hypothetical protein
VSVVTRATCPHGRGVFAWLGDGPQRGDQADPNWGRYPWVHGTAAGPGHLEVCDLMQFALPVDVGEMCACGHSSGMHEAKPGPVPAGLLASPRLCHCGCPDFRHRREDLERWAREAAPAALSGRPARSPVPVEPGVQMELFAAERAERRALAHRVPVETVLAAGDLL